MMSYNSCQDTSISFHQSKSTINVQQIKPKSKLYKVYPRYVRLIKIISVHLEHRCPKSGPGAIFGP